MKMQAGAGDGVGGSEEAFREYRALLAESEPWKEEVFMLEIVAALQVSPHSTHEPQPTFVRRMHARTHARTHARLHAHTLTHEPSHAHTLAGQAIKILYKASFEIKLTKMIKNIPGGVFTLLHNANRRRQHGSG